MVWALEHLDGEKNAQLVDLLASGTTDPAELAQAVELIERGGGIERCRELARERADQAKALADELVAASSITVEAHDLLVSMADFFVERAG